MTLSFIGWYYWHKRGHWKSDSCCPCSDPPVKPLEFILDESDADAFQLLCGCAETATPPFCDGSFGKVSVEEVELTGKTLLTF